MSPEDGLEHAIRQLDGVVSCQLTDTEAVVMLFDDADTVAVAAAVGRILAGTDPPREVRLLGGTMAIAKPARSGSAVAAWVVAGLLAATVVGLAVALAVDSGGSSTATGPLPTSLIPATTVAPTTVLPGTSMPLTTGPLTTGPLTTGPLATGPVIVLPPRTTTTAPPPSYAVFRRGCRQDGTM